jgi:hypothetical protein
MSMSTQPPEKQSGGMTAPALRFRTSMTLWGPLQLTLTNHLAGAELGYEAGRAAYYQEGSDEILESAMQRFLAAPRYRPRACTARVIAEWQAMFLLGWTSGLLEEEPLQKLPREAITDEQHRQEEASMPTVPIATHGSKRWRGQR